MQPICVICLPHSGSSYFAKTLHYCGMQVGNKNTWWHENWDIHTEHSLISRMAGRLVTGPQKSSLQDDLEWRKWLRMVDEEPEDEKIYRWLHNILAEYKNQAKKCGWKHFGFKVTTWTSFDLFDKFKFIVEQQWPDVVWLSTLRHPLEIVRGLEREGKDVENFIDRYIEFTHIQQELITGNGYLAGFPDSWLDGEIRRLVSKLGMKFNPDVFRNFDKTKPNHMLDKGVESEEEKNFGSKYPKAVLAYTSLLSKCKTY